MPTRSSPQHGYSPAPTKQRLLLPPSFNAALSGYGSPHVPNNPLPSPNSPVARGPFFGGLTAYGPTSFGPSEAEPTFTAAASPSANFEQYEFSRSSTLSPASTTTQALQTYVYPQDNASPPSSAAGPKSARRRSGTPPTRKPRSSPVLHDAPKKNLALLTAPLSFNDLPSPARSPSNSGFPAMSDCTPSPSPVPSPSQRRDLPLKEKYANREPNSDGTYSCEAEGCQVCQTKGIQKFTQLCKLEKHEDKTTKPYCCPVQDCRQGRNVRGFSRRDNRQTHIKDIHPERMASKISSPSSPSESISQPVRQQRRPRQSSREQTIEYERTSNHGDDDEEQFVITVKRRLSPGRNDYDGSLDDEPRLVDYRRSSFHNSRHSPVIGPNTTSAAGSGFPPEVLEAALHGVKHYRSEVGEDRFDYRQKPKRQRH